MTTLSRPNLPLSFCRYIFLALYASLAGRSAVFAQVQNPASPPSGSPSSDQSGQLAVLDGVVLNALTNQPVSRVLVQAGSHAILTEHDGKFQISDTSGLSAVLRVTKPGFYDGLEPNPSGRRIIFGAAAEPIKIYVYPEGLITGSIAAPNGDPIPSVFVQALRKSGDESGVTWITAAQASTNSDGQFRLPVSAGDYVIETHYVPDRPIRGAALLPAMAPDAVNGNGEGSQPAIHLDSGTEQHLDLRPELRSIHEVHIHLDEGSERGVPQIEAHLPNGLSFFPASRQSGAPGEFIISLPTGSYTLTTANNQGDGASYAQTTVNVGDTDVSGVVMHSIRSLPMPVEVAVDGAASSSTTSDNQPPSAPALGLHFIRTDHGAPAANSSVYLRGGRGETAFNLTPGRYRLLGQPLSRWFIESASVNGTDLLTQDLDVESGGTSAPLRIVVSNNTAGIKGNVKLDGSPGASCWVYLVAETRGVTPVVYAISGSDGTFSSPYIPPGSYRAVAFETHHVVDFTDSATLERLAPYMKSLTVAPGEVASLDIDAIPTLELRH